MAVWGRHDIYSQEWLILAGYDVDCILYSYDTGVYLVVMLLKTAKYAFLRCLSY
jgi:hypothetical protein